VWFGRWFGLAGRREELRLEYLFLSSASAGPPTLRRRWSVLPTLARAALLLGAVVAAAAEVHMADDASDRAAWVVVGLATVAVLFSAIGRAVLVGLGDLALAGAFAGLVSTSLDGEAIADRVALVLGLMCVMVVAVLQLMTHLHRARSSTRAEAGDSPSLGIVVPDD